LQEESRRRAAENVRPELRLLPEFADVEAAAWAQRAQLGAITEIRLKFEQLSRLIADGIEQRGSPSAATDVAVPIERVIVYVDDLDRCQPDVVVGVLETLKLLVSLPHFVVVVGVDSRWLFRSLKLHFRELLADDDGAPDAEWAATPQNYLEKIFQYSVVLQPISEKGFGALIAELVGPTQAPGTPVGHERHDGPTPTGASPGRASPPPVAPESPPAPAGATAAAPGVDLNPTELVITPEELRFMVALSPLFETPRAAKRLVNVYRLLRVSVGADRLLDREGYEPALLLLAIGIGFPAQAGETFSELAASSAMWPEFVQHLEHDARGRLTRAAQPLPNSLPDTERRALEESQGEFMADALVRAKLADALRRVAPDAVADLELNAFKPWIPVVAGFSFHPWQVLLPAGTRD
jgi:hypothetical protein